MSRLLPLWACLLMVSLVCSAVADELDFGANVKRLDTDFDRYILPAKSIHRDPRGVRFHLIAGAKDTRQTGLASKFAIAGDFEISTDYEWTPVAVPKEGYGVSCGIRVEAGDLSISLARGNLKGMGSAYIVSKGVKAGNEKQYSNEKPVSTKAKTGKLVLRRVKKDVLCLAADETEELTELYRVPFTTGTAQKVLLFADPGGTSAALEVRLVNIKIRAEEITTTRFLAKRDEPSALGWYLGGGFLVVATAAVAFWFYRGKQRDA